METTRKGGPKEMFKAKNKPVSNNKESLLPEIDALKNHIRRLEIEKGILEKTTELLKKIWASI